MEIDDSPYARLLRSVLSDREKTTGAYEDPSRPVAGGKWSEPGVPHSGWYVVDYYKLDDREHLCEMCERQMVMFVHVMRNDRYPEDLKVGCVCAGHMESDLEGDDSVRFAIKTSGNVVIIGFLADGRTRSKPAGITSEPTAWSSAYIRPPTIGARQSGIVAATTNVILNAGTKRPRRRSWPHSR